MTIVVRRCSDASTAASGRRTPMKVRTLLEEFDYTAEKRVRQTSWRPSSSTFSDGPSITPFRGGRVGPTITSRSHAVRRNRPPCPLRQTAPTGAEEPESQHAHFIEAAVAGSNPLEFAFDLDGRRRGNALDEVTSIIWAAQPVCFFLHGEAEFAASAAGYLAAIMRRRNRSYRTDAGSESLAEAPVVLTPSELRHVLSSRDDLALRFPVRSSVYLVHAAAENLEDDEIASKVREQFIPHTYRLRARFTSTRGESAGSNGAMAAPRWEELSRWLRAFTGAPSANLVEPAKDVQLASLLAEACQVREILFERAARQASHGSFKSGFESGEHLVLKNLVAKHLELRYPGERLTIEEG